MSGILQAFSPLPVRYATIDETIGYMCRDGAYRVDDQGGGVSSCKWGREWRPLLPSSSKDGYPMASLFWRGGGSLRIAIHILVCHYFHGPKPKPDPDPYEVCHQPHTEITDFRAESLFWGTHKENMACRRIDGTDARGEKSANAKLTWDLVRYIRANGSPGSSPRLTAGYLASVCGVRSSTVRCVLQGKTWIET